MHAMTVPSTRTIALLTAATAGLALGIALISEKWGGLAPCALCLWERWPYRAIIALGLIAASIGRGPARALLWLAVVALLSDVAIAALHVGVEQHAWASPLPECQAPSFSGGSIADMLKAMPAHPAKPCDAASYLIPGLPLSMAAMNLLFGIAFSLVLAVALWRNRRGYA
jgi:disulfide bond formation protein DsbB